MAGNGKSKLDELLAKTAKRAARIRAAQQAAQEHVQAEILNPASSRTGASRERLYREIYKTYGNLEKVEADEIYGICRDAEEASVADAYAMSGGDLVLATPDPQRVRDLFSIVSTSNGESLAAVHTRRISARAVSRLRNALVKISRQGAIEGWNARQIQAKLKEEWDRRAGDTDNFRFVDRAGRKWSNDAYVQMLTRTTAQRAYNEAALNRYAEMGCRYVRITSFGEPDCKICKQWNNLVVRITDDGDGAVPTVEDAQEAGVFHPNCMCFLEAVDDGEVEA